MANLSNINNKFIVTDTGHVSIGATTTTYPLTVESGGVGTVLRAGTSFVSIDSVGSAASPSLIFNGDSNTGIWRPASDTLGFSTAGVERFKIGTSSALLIGTSYQLKFTTDDGSTQLGKLFDDVGFTVEGKLNNNLNLRSLANSTGEGIKFQNKTGGVLSTHMFIGRLGNITIGNGETGLVFAKLCLSGDPYVVTSSGQARGGIDVRSNVNPGAGLYTGGISFGGASNGRAAISGVQGTSTDGDRQGLAFFTHGSGTGSADAAEAMRISTDGNVGIGTDSPDALLHVKAPNNTIGSMILGGGNNPVTDVGQINTELNFGSNDGSAVPFGGSIKTVTEFSNGAYVGMAFYTCQQGRSPTLAEAMRITNGGQLLINATTSGYGANNYGYNLGVRGTASQAFISIARNTQTLDTQGMIVGVDSNTGYLIMRDNLPIDFYNNDTFRMRIATNGNVGIGTTGPGAKLDVNQDGEDWVQRNYGSGNNQGAPQKITITKWYPVTSLGTKLLIPVISQGNLNSTTMVRMWGHSAVFNRSNNYTNRSFTLDFTFGSLQLIYGLTTLNSSGNISSVTQTSTTGGTNGEIQVNFTNNYIQSQTGSSYGGVYITLEYMTNSTNKSIIPSGIALN